MAKTATEVAQEFMAYCTKNYEKGWDFIVECHTVSELAAEFETEGVKSLKAAKELYSCVKEVRADWEAEAEYQGRDCW